MKTLFTLLLLLISLTLTAQSTNTKPVKETTSITTDSITKSGITYKLHTGSRGGKYIIRTSKKSGNTYKQYFKQEQLAKLKAK